MLSMKFLDCTNLLFPSEDERRSPVSLSLHNSQRFQKHHEGNRSIKHPNYSSSHFIDNGVSHRIISERGGLCLQVTILRILKTTIRTPLFISTTQRMFNVHESEHEDDT